MIPTISTQDKILAMLEQLNLFRAVAAYPLARLNEETFPHDLIKLQLPAALLVFVSDDHKGRPWEHRINWLLVLIARDTTPEAGRFILAACDAIRADVLTKAVEGNCFLLPDSTVNALESTATYTAASMNLSTVERA
jgi:hypothetical protein